MSTKNLARTLVECGSRTDWRENRRASNRSERRRWRAHCHRLSLDQEVWLEHEPAEPLPLCWGYSGKREHSSQALSRWLQSQIGQRWDDVYSRLCRKFPRRSWRGHRILEEQIRYWIGFEDDPHSGWRDLIVDHEGILRSDKDYEWNWTRSPRPQHAEPDTWPVHEQVIPDLDAIMDGYLESAYFIVNSGEFCWVEVLTWHIEVVWKDGEWRECYHPLEYTRTRKLTSEEVEHLQSLSGHEYRNLRWQSAMRSRKGQNTYRRYQGREELPELLLEN